MTIYSLKTRLGFILLIGVLLLFNNSDVLAQEAMRFKTVVIDAGHGGKDPGAVGKISKEKDIVLNVALQLGSYIEKNMPDVKVVYTRTSDVFIPLNKRAEIANENKADLFISIHANAISTSKIHGAETFVLGLHRTKENLEVAKMENSVIVLEEDYTTNYEGFDPNLAESYIIFELMQNIHIDQSIYMASILQSQFKNRVGRRDRGVKQAGFLVLRKATMPSVLVELGFLTNQAEEKFLASKDGQTYLASALYRAVRDYKEEFDSKSKMEDIAKLALEREENLVQYRIQIASSKKAIKQGANVYKKFDDIWMYKDGGYYKYTTSCSSDYQTIVSSLNSVKDKIADAFIVAFKGDSKISVSEARNFQRQQQ
ncbi:N-acetylmuramoyl-L-alanine amidase [Carboxylicivirga sp. M1479]|uniref:N-acetylmuramoyl-L-alanine amidase family protein n=1 Tax=Carboxylicivirga sp. M1479 TaxID=2594476 RepID=UPI00117793BA|nr:N-acetylmuramoyl-L-alanine amidase [Carboxylicivirga sp. M1479]TRX70268.1 N-acetylmuramoyl-L-alanine amidase [Carboxylicivirga sp. M1479]